MNDTVRSSNAVPAHGASSTECGAIIESMESASDLLGAALARVGRLEALLASTGGGVHDVNNLLTILAGDLYLLTESVRHDRPMFEKMRSARNTVERASTLMRELLTFSSNPVDEPSVICPVNHVLALEPMLRRCIATGQTLSIHHGEVLWSVAASAAQFESAVTNLVLNARDAVSANGTIQIHVKNLHCSDTVIDGERLRGDFVCVRVTDNGVGIPKNLLAKVSEPLVTSKAVGHGSGLGLSMVKRFTRNAGGAMTIESTVGSGTTVKLWLPRDCSAVERTANITLPLSTLKGGDETVLLALDDVDVRATVQQILEAVGYRVIVRNGLPGSCESLTGESRPNVVLCNRSTDKAAQERVWLDVLRKRDTSLRHVAILSAGSDTSVAADADAYLYRPIGVLELTRAVRVALEQRS